MSAASPVPAAGDSGPALQASPAAMNDAAVVESPQPLTTAPGQPNTDQTSYFASPRTEALADSPMKAASGSRSSADLLRRLSLVDGDRPATPYLDPQVEYPALNLTGRILSATFCIPHTLGFKSGRDWDIRPRRGTSALFDSFTHLSETGGVWDHTLVGWTGEIKPSDEIPSRPQSPVEGSSSSKNSLNKTLPVPLNNLSAPVPVDGSVRPSAPQPHGDGIRVTKADRECLEKQLRRDKSGKIVPVWLMDKSEDNKDDVVLKDQGRWRRYAEHEIYTLFHYKQHEPTDGRAERRWWTDYCQMNQMFADRILEIYKPGDIVWVHDYHLLLLPSILRQRLPHIYLGFFLHVPFPSSEFLRCLSRRKEILTGVLGANMIGFQTFSYSRHFSSCCTRILGFDAVSAGVDAYGAHIAVDVFPIGIDAAACAKLAYGNRVIEDKIQRIRAQYAGQKIIVGRDRMDTVRGVAQKLQAFEKFLERHPEWRGKVVLIQVTSPTSIEEEKEDGGHKMANKISNLVAKINGLYGGLEYTPVFHFPQYLSQDEYFALLRVADVGLITSVRDGMNTTSLEYVVCQRDNHGPLILSEFSGTAGSLTSAMHINPWDLIGVAEAIHQALTMPAEEKANQQRMSYRHVTTNTVQLWQKTYLTRLLANLASFNQSFSTPPLDRALLLTRYRLAKKRLFMFDYDGTLTPIVKDPQAAIPTDRVIRTIKTLAQDKRNAVWIISGRDQAFLDEWMGHISELGLSAEHGSFIRHPETDEWENLTEKVDMGWQKEVMEIFQHYTEKTQGSFIERKRIALTWHYRRSDPEYGAFQARECKKHLENTVGKKWDVEVMSGKANLEVRPTFVNKGEIAKRLVASYGFGSGEPPEFILCLGDDNTDEGNKISLPRAWMKIANVLLRDMFRTLRATKLPQENVFSVTVGASSKQTLASWHLLEPADVIAAVALLNGNVSGSNVDATLVAGY
ncbi:threalose-6-phosphate phosphatase [Xylographa pallens]|nr:threalose-6-phosphate phosphatase [Xylographa pallens]